MTNMRYGDVGVACHYDLVVCLAGGGVVQTLSEAEMRQQIELGQNSELWVCSQAQRVKYSN